MKILILGSGGREHALSWKIKQSPKVSKVYCCPGNGGSENNIPGNLKDLESILKIAQDLKVDLTIVGPEDPLCAGIVDLFEAHKMPIFGPNKKAARLEESKDYSKKFMDKYIIRNAKYDTVTSFEEAKNTLDKYNFPLVIKADGLCQGKGVIIAENKKDALDTLESIFLLDQFGDAGKLVLLEEFLDGKEVSLICLVSNNKIFPLDTARDYKKIHEGDLGLNTGGVGAYSPAIKFNDLQNDEVKSIIKNIENGFNKENLHFNGVLFIGLMLCGDDVNVLEFNVRFGDPETQVILPRLESDLLDIMLKVNNGKITQEDIIMSKDSSMTTVLVSKGYPETFTTDHSILINDQGLVFHNGTIRKDGEILSKGGRVLSVVGLGSDFTEINHKLLARIEKIDFENKSYRKDIGILA